MAWQVCATSVRMQVVLLEFLQPAPMRVQRAHSLGLGVDAVVGDITSPAGPTLRGTTGGADCGAWFTYTMKAAGPPHVCLLRPHGMVQPLEPLPWRREGARSFPA
jgi:hypothetical protein